MGKISAVDLFSSWAEMGKDEGMETGHAPSVEFMISKSVKGFAKFSTVHLKVYSDFQDMMISR